MKDNYKKEKYIKLLREMDKTAKLLVRRDLELKEVNEELDEKVKSLEEAKINLLEMNDILEIRLKARTRQLRENILNLDRQVKERTKKLENSKKALINILQDIKEEKEKNLAIINNFSDGLLIFNNRNRLNIINKKAEIFLKIQDGKIFLNKSSKELQGEILFKSLIDLVGIKLNKIFRKEFEIEKDLILEVSIDILPNNQGKFLILHNITREKTVERLKTEFVSIAAHQLRTPLSAIKWTLTMILDGDLGKLNKDQQKYLKKTNLSNERMINLVDDLLNLSRIEEGRYVIKNDYLSLVDLTKEVMSDECIKAKKKKLKFNLKKSGKTFKIFADREKIKLVIQNLVENAINYSFENEEINITIKKRNNKNEIEFSIKNSGIGISQDDQKRIFTKFFRAENATRKETVGSGLGLFINKNIIESHGGNIWFSSVDSGETIFCFTLPVGKTKKT